MGHLRKFAEGISRIPLLPRQAGSNSSFWNLELGFCLAKKPRDGLICCALREPVPFRQSSLVYSYFLMVEGAGRVHFSLGRGP